MTLSCGSLFSGGGLADVGLCAAGYAPRWAVENCEAAADAYEANLGAHVIRADVRTVDPRALEPVSLLWASPPCQMFSAARSKSLPSNGTEDLGLACIPFLEVLRPPVFLLENVPQYAGSAPFQVIVAALYRLGYMVDFSNVNAANMGVPQTRNRLILRASLLGLLPPLPAPVPWVGWYAAIEDLLPTLPESAFAKWQLQRLSTHPFFRDFLLMTGNTQMAMPTGTGILEADAPANTVTSAGTQARAYLVEAKNTGQERGKGFREPTEPAFSVLSDNRPSHAPQAYLVSGTSDCGVRDGAEPAHSVVSTVHEKAAMDRAYLVADSVDKWGDGLRGAEKPAPSLTVTGARHVRRAAVSGGRVVSLTPRALARLMSVPDSYILPTRRVTACRILGNGVPSLLSQRLAEQFVDALERRGP